MALECDHKPASKQSPWSSEMLKRRQAMIALLVGLVTMVAITATVYGHVTGLFHYHAGVGYITQLWADPTNPVDGRYGVFTWIYINPTYNDPSTSSDQSGWLGVNIRNGGTYARVQAGHGRLSDNSQDVFVELFYSNPYILSCRGGSTFVLYGPDSATCRASQSMFNVPYDWWYTLAMGDYAEDGRWKVGIKIQSILIAVIDFDNASGFAGQHHMGEITANGT